MSIVDEGTYLAIATGAELGFTNGGNEQVAISCKITEEGPFKGRTLAYYGGFSNEKSIDFTLAALRSAGWTGDDISDLSSVNGSKPISIVIYHDDYNEKITAKIKFINAAGGVALKNKMNQGEAKSFAAKMRGHILANSPSGSTSSKSRQQEEGSYLDDSAEEQPFARCDAGLIWNERSGKSLFRW